MHDRVNSRIPRGRVAVVGAGVSGLACARALRQGGWRVSCFDRGSRPGGRLATRSTAAGEFDHGAQYFTARDEEFARAVRDWESRGIVREWRAKVVRLERGRLELPPEPTRRWVGSPRMSRLAEHLAEGLDVERADIVALEKDSGWRLRRGDGTTEGPFDLVVLAMPPSQIARLVREEDPFAARIAGVSMSPTIALLVSFAPPPELPFDAAFVHGSPLAWIARNSGKPERHGENWVLHAGPEWSRDHLAASDDGIATSLLEALADASGRDIAAPHFSQVHRWRAAAPVEPWPEPFVLEEAAGLAACGDWCAGPRVEGAWLSGTALAARLLA